MERVRAVVEIRDILSERGQGSKAKDREGRIKKEGSTMGYRRNLRKEVTLPRVRSRVWLKDGPSQTLTAASSWS